MIIHSTNGLYTVDKIRQCEQYAYTHLDIDAHRLMEKAGAEAYQILRRLYPDIANIAVFCGSGNNAGDGYVLARLAHEEGLLVTIYQCRAPELLPEEASIAAIQAIESGILVLSAEESLDDEIELIVDALLGIGAKGDTQGLILSSINQMNESGLPVISLDIPSGLEADTGRILGTCVRARHTITFIAPKQGMYTSDGPDFCGIIHVCNLQLQNCLKNNLPSAYLLQDKGLPLPNRLKNSHKGDFGHILIVGGGPGMAGAVALAAKAALRIGAGKVTIATWPDHSNGSLLAMIPEAIVYGVTTPEELIPLLQQATVCVLGPGLGESVWATNLFYYAITSQAPMVIDASALHLLAKNSQQDDNWILTPHPGEAASLLETTTANLPDRFTTAKNIQKQYGGIVVLKGVGTLIQTETEQTYICPLGNPGMATAGMGDVLSGIISGLLAQGLSLAEAAKLGVWIHAKAADKIAQHLGERGLLASDLLSKIPLILNGKMDDY